jgi:hypothetical protein
MLSSNPTPGLAVAVGCAVALGSTIAVGRARAGVSAAGARADGAAVGVAEPGRSSHAPLGGSAHAAKISQQISAILLIALLAGMLTHNPAHVKH